ncbi:MAG: hypothetical protein HY808_09920 [Nitrospirae bacterium]|nr:hypothetical protein [Nitrospirota bacterium]
MNNNNEPQIAHELREAFEAVDPFIQKHTALVCPSCKKVCCIAKHGRHDEKDITFLSALKFETPCLKFDSNDTDPCGFLNAEGCSIERWMRPFRCTWFFCDPLLESMKGDKGRAYRRFIESFQRLVLLRQELLNTPATDKQQFKPFIRKA